jgi:hypothetical protein
MLHDHIRQALSGFLREEVMTIQKRMGVGPRPTVTVTRIWLPRAALRAGLGAVLFGAAAGFSWAADPTPMDSDNGVWVGETAAAKLTITKDGSRPSAQLYMKKSRTTLDCIEIAIGKTGSVDMWCGQKNHGLRTQGFLVHGTFPALTMQPGGDYSAGNDQGPIPVTYQGPAAK